MSKLVTRGVVGVRWVKYVCIAAQQTRLYEDEIYNIYAKALTWCETGKPLAGSVHIQTIVEL